MSNDLRKITLLAADIMRGRPFDIICHELELDEQSARTDLFTWVWTQCGEKVTSVYEARQAIIGWENERRAAAGTCSLEREREIAEQQQRDQIAKNVLSDRLAGLESQVAQIRHELLPRALAAEVKKASGVGQKRPGFAEDPLA